MGFTPNWYLRQAQDNDTDVNALLEFLSVPQVYRYLLDGMAPERQAVVQWIKTNQPDSAQSPFGLWILQSNNVPIAGFVSLKPYPETVTAELTYALHPSFWRMGLATRMGWTIIERAFQSDIVIDKVIAGADEPNTASTAVMRRLGMRFLRTVDYPLGTGLEYLRRRDDAVLEPLPEIIAIRS